MARRGRFARRLLITGGTLVLVLGLGAGPAFACGGLVSANGTIALTKTTTMAAYHNGLEHYVTGFEFVGNGAEFGSIVPLPANPLRIIRGGDWTLQRLVREVTPQPLFFALDAAGGAERSAAHVQVLQEKDVDSLHLTVVKGGAFGVGKWAEEQGFVLSPDAPAVLDFYAKRSPYFMAVEFDAKKARNRGEQIGDAIPIHLVMKTNEPWVPLRILGLGAPPKAPIEADVFLLTDQAPNMLPVPAGHTGSGPAAPGLEQVRSEPANRLLLSDLGSDRGMKWVPRHGMWFTYLSLDAKAGDLTYDLALNVNGGAPSAVDAGLSEPGAAASSSSAPPAGVWAVVVGIALLFVLVVAAGRERRGGPKVAI
jgi:hypothetical protein